MVVKRDRQVEDGRAFGGKVVLVNYELQITNYELRLGNQILGISQFEGGK